jgi:hypothetical protein
MTSDLDGQERVLIEPTMQILCKLGSIARHVEEANGPGGKQFDVEAATGLVEDHEVQAWMAEMDKLALLPVKR